MRGEGGFDAGGIEGERVAEVDDPAWPVEAGDARGQVRVAVIAEVQVDQGRAGHGFAQGAGEGGLAGAGTSADEQDLWQEVLVHDHVRGASIQGSG
ncbi:hypothetical protein [Streptomyces sp. MT206]|uniref:hypothetical protein n=1 Tax=Streptomyces sp. MT206 TaxID=3031407 RepID=UPI002FC81D20